jgi:DNA polymerase/3'-5' exonuclease PolX
VSQGEPIPRWQALAIAQSLVAILAPACERIEIAGSIRRHKPMVRDIEIVAVARWEDRPVGDLWATRSAVDVLEETLGGLLFNGFVEPRQVENHRADGSIDLQTKLGPSFKALVCDGMPVDLFIVRSPATWGCIFGLRTGPGDWNTRLVMDCKAIGRRVEGGQVLAWHGGSSSWRPMPTPEERDFFAALGQPWVEPPDRSVERVAIRRSAAVPS